ncbi:hypothetical protein HW532_17265 [Kaustia mangrovi]|uniref:Uncharacterized protein n=1 Tax=Kaustia mangrovi TaxID=2593653 RepID=A0A7S8C6H8_9HYPH|nr:hypothetical protein [Kaustia mangrovi]QPC44291.1 hypothetical protein HW532_17265 [Kaustia mangrovi]
MWTTMAAIVSSLVGIVGLFASWRKSHKDELRRDDVLRWSNEAIRTLESLFLVCIHGESRLGREVSEDKMTEIMFDTAILVESGRIFFKNEIIDGHGGHKYPAYRGYRPEILDCLVIAHKISRDWIDADNDKRLRMKIVSEDCLKKFVSLAQKEVGRDRNSSIEAGVGGSGSDLEDMLRNVDQNR